MPNFFVTNNVWLKMRLDQDILTTNQFEFRLRLFQNDIIPTPASVRSNFAEANFPGYLPINLAFKLGPSVKIEDGIYQSVTNVNSFLRTGPSTQIIYGFFVTAAPGVMCAYRFPNPYDMASVDAVDVVFILREADISVACM